MKSCRAYLLANRSHTALSIGVTDDLPRRLSEHRSKTVDGFTKKYHTDRLVDYERTNDVRAAIAREKQLKAWRRAKKDALIESVNPQWRDLSISRDPSAAFGMTGAARENILEQISQQRRKEKWN